MRCSTCHRHLQLLDSGRPLRLLLPRCRFCRRYTFGPVHKVALVLLVVLLLIILATKVQVIGG